MEIKEVKNKMLDKWKRLPREIIHSDLITSDVYLEVPKINNKYLCGEYKIIPIDTVEFEKKNKVVK